MWGDAIQALISLAAILSETVVGKGGTGGVALVFVANALLGNYTVSASRFIVAAGTMVEF